MRKPFVLGSVILLSTMLTPAVAATLQPVFSMEQAATDSTSTAKKDSKKKEEKKKLSDYEKLFDKKKKHEVQDGLIKIHKVDNEKIYFEFPLNLIGREMMFGSTVAEISNNQHGVLGYKSKYPMHVKFERQGEKVNLCLVNSLYTSKQENIMKAVEKSTLASIFQSFKIAAHNADSTAVVFEATPLFMSHIVDIDPFDMHSAFGMKPFSRSVSFKKDRSHLGDIKSFEDNFSVSSYLTYESNVTYTKGMMRAKVETNMPVTALVNRSFILLPEEPMRPRLGDPRVNIFVTGKANFETESNRGTLPEYYARRWDLEPKDMAAWKRGELVEPIKPIVFYVDDAFPESWVGPISEGIEQWNEAFEKAGFKNAIQAKPFPKNDPEFDPDNLKYSCVRYQPIAIKNAMGPSWFDPRSGEIFNASVMVYHDVMKLISNWLFAQTAAANPRVRTGEIPQDIMDDALRYVIAHEIGHCLSLMHNMASSAAIPVEKLRDPKFTQENGTTYSIMDYARFNYVAQPGDMKKGVKLTPPRLGVYDYFSIDWLYRPLPEAATYRDEEPILSKMISDKSGDPRYRYGKQQIYSILDPSSQSEDLGDDAVKASEYGVKNLKYIMKNMNKWMKDSDHDLSRREELYKVVINQYFQFMMHVYSVKGGVYLNERYQGDKRPSYEFVDGDYQRRAQEFLCEQLADLDWLEPQDLLQEIPLVGNMSIKMQRTILSLIAADRGTLDGIKVKEKNAFTIEDNQQMAIESIFASTIEGKDLTDREMTNQNGYIELLMMMSNLDRKKGSSPMGIADSDNDWFEQSLAWDTEGLPTSAVAFSPGTQTPEEVSGFAFFRGLPASMSPKFHIYYAKVLQIKKLLEENKDNGSEETRLHYELLLHRINGVLL